MRATKPTFSAAVVNILDADDVVFAEIAAGLHLDQFEIDLAGVGQTMFAADRQVNRFVFVNVTWTSPLRVTSAVPRTTIQCSAR